MVMSPLKHQKNGLNQLIRKYMQLAEKPYDGKEPRKLVNAFKKDLIRKMPNHDYARPPHRRIIFPLGYELAFKIPFTKYKEVMEHLDKQS